MAMRIGEVAANANVNVQTVRYYERRGLLPRPERTRSGYRQYGDLAVRRLQFIKRAQELGFTLGEVRELLNLRVEDASACGTVERRTRAKLAQVEQKIDELERMKRTLEQLVRTCQAKQHSDDCPILEMLDDAVPPG